MTLKEYKMRNNKILSALIILPLVGIAACGGGLSREHRPLAEQQDDVYQGNDEDIPDFITGTLNIPAGSQLFALGTNGDASSSLAPAHYLAATSLGTNSQADTRQLFVVDAASKATAFLKNVDTDRLLQVKDGNNIAYLVRVTADYIHEQGRKTNKYIRGQWYLFKKGQDAIKILPHTKNYWMNDTEFVGQTETNGYLAFSDGNFVTMEGKQQSYGTNIHGVRRATSVSGDIVAIEREVRGSNFSVLVNVKTNFRKAYGNTYSLNYVQIKNDGAGLLSDSSKSANYANDETQMSSLLDEMSSTGSKISNLYKSADTKDVLWFNNSIKIPNQEAALLIGYVSARAGTKQGDHLIWVTPHAAGGWEFELLEEFKNSNSFVSHGSKPFIQGETYTIVKKNTEFLLVTHATKKVQEFTTNFAMIFEIRPSDDLKQFIIVGEKNNGDQFQSFYDATGALVKEDKITGDNIIK